MSTRALVVNFCPNCGTKAREVDVFCGSCGHRLGSPASASPQATPPGIVGSSGWRADVFWSAFCLGGWWLFVNKQGLWRGSPWKKTATLGTLAATAAVAGLAWWWLLFVVARSGIDTANLEIVVKAVWICVPVSLVANFGLAYQVSNQWEMPKQARLATFGGIGIVVVLIIATVSYTGSNALEPMLFEARVRAGQGHPYSPETQEIYDHVHREMGR